MTIMYCSRECQVNHWKFHKLACGNFDRERWKCARNVCGNSFYSTLTGAICHHLKLKETQVLSCVLSKNSTIFSDGLVDMNMKECYIFMCRKINKLVYQNYMSNHCNIITDILFNGISEPNNKFSLNIIVTYEDCKQSYNALSKSHKFRHWRYIKNKLWRLVDFKNSTFILL